MFALSVKLLRLVSSFHTLNLLCNIGLITLITYLKDYNRIVAGCQYVILKNGTRITASRKNYFTSLLIALMPVVL